ncbi:MAG: hypothetical protein C0506_13915 [Anaerolinea sp.]|nr:hypothetical protein [Anaerolinea sp.]
MTGSSFITRLRKSNEFGSTQADWRAGLRARADFRASVSGEDKVSPWCQPLGHVREPVAFALR